MVDPESLWRLLIEGVDAVSEVPPERWDVRRFYNADASVPGKTYARHGGFIAQSPYEFDAAFFGLSNREAAVLDPQQRLLLEATWEAFEDAGHDCHELRGRRVGVFVGAFSLDNFADRFGTVSRDFISPSTATSATMVMLSNRLSHTFDFVGPSLSVDTACSSSLVATHLACTSLKRGECELAIAAGVNVMLAPEPFIAMAKGGFLSRDGRCKAFDASADGYVRAEGVGVVVLKPLMAALADGDRIYATILASGVNQDGRTPGISMPSLNSQRSLIRQVLRDAGLSGRDIACVEAHGPGTQAGDPVEAHALGAEIGAGRSQEEAVWVGSIKTNIGHTEAAAGIAGLIKGALVLYHRTMPPNLHFKSANPNIDLAALGLRIPVAPQPLARTGPLHAAVNSFGYGGTNAHAIMAAPPAPAPADLRSGEPALRLYPVSARSDQALASFASAVAGVAREMPSEDLGHALARRRAHHPVRAAAWARSGSELAEVLNDLEHARASGRASVGSAPERPRRLLFVYSGMGSQYVGMGRELFAKERVFREEIERCDALLAQSVGVSLVSRFAGRADDGAQGAPIGAPRDAQLPNLMIQVALTALWRSLGLRPDGVLGHSVGEIAAAWAAGALPLEEALRLTYHRGEAFQRLLGKGSMMAVGLGLDAATALLKERSDDIAVTAVLAPDSVVVGGPPAALDKLASQLSAAGVFNRRLHVDVAYHHRQVDLIEDDLRARFGSVAHGAPALPLYSTLYGRRVEKACHDAGYWWQNSRSVADFASAITAAIGDGFDAVLEVGPNRVMSAAVKSCAAVKGQAMVTAASMVRGESEVQQVRQTLADLYVQGVSIDWAAHHPSGRFMRYPRYPWQRERLWTEAPETRAARSLQPNEPWLHQRLDGPSAAWITDLSASMFDYLADHVVAGTPLFPAAGHIAALLAASRALGRGNCVDGLRFERALPLGQGTSIRIDIDEGSGAATVCARTGPTGPWQRYARGRLGLARRPSRERVDLQLRRRECTRHIVADDLYAALADHGLAYGPAFRAVREIWFGKDHLVAVISLPEDLADDGPLHPVLLDAAFQALTAVASADEGRAPLVPVSVGEVRLNGAVTGSAWVAARVEERTATSFTASLSLCDADGRVVAEIDGLRCQRLPVAEPDRLAHAAFEDTWERTSLPPHRRTSAQRWMLIADEDRFAAQLAAELRHHGHEARLVSPVEAADATQAAPVHGVIWLTPTSDRDDAGLDATKALLRMIQSVASLPRPSPRLVIVTRGATGATPRPDHAAVWGLGRVAAAEHPELQVALVDCHDDERVPLWLAREVLGDTLEREVRLGSDGRSVCRVQPWSAPETEAEPVAVHDVPVILRQARAGAPDSLTWHEVRRRRPGPGEIEIRSVAAALNFKDVLKSMNLLSGAYLEATFFGDNLGMEAAGIVTRVGEGVTRWAPGDEVVAISPHFASYLIADASLVRKKPAGFTFAQAPVFTNYITAHHGLVDIARLQPGERVLIHLGSGGVGQAAISVSRMIGAEIFATAGDADKRAYLKSQGIEHVFDSRSLDFAEAIKDITHGAGVDVVLNSLTGEALRRSWDVLAPYGRFIEIGKRDIEDDAPLPMRRFDENRMFAAVDVDRIIRERPALFQRILDDLDRLFSEGRLGPLPTTAFPAKDVSEAFRLMARARHIGKVVIEFEGQSVPARRLPAPRFKGDRTYLVSGAFGGFGTALVRWMAREGARHLALVGRSGAATDEGAALVEEMRSLGVSVSVHAMDVAEQESVAALLAQIRADGPPLAGIFHAAMVLDDGLLSSLDAARVEAVMRPKALGAWHLHRCSLGDPVEHFVLFSSVAQMIGNVGQGSYCAANAFLDGLARRRRAEGLPALSIAWGALGDVGVAARSKGLLARLEKAGVRGLTAAQALAALGRFMDGAPPCVAFADVDWGRWAGHAELAATPRFKNIVQSGAGGDRLAVFRRELLAQPAAERAGVLHAKLTAALSPVLGVPAERIPLDRALDGLGVDSLMAVELSVAFERDCGIKLPTSLLMQGPTIAEIAAHVLKEMVSVENLDEAAIDALSEAEADALLAMLAERGELDLAGVS